MSEEQTNIFKHKKETDDSDTWCILENDKVIFRGIPSEALAEQFEEFICKRDADWIGKISKLSKENYALRKLTEFSQELLANTLSDKLSDLDNMYALKLMMKETMDVFEGLIQKIESAKEK